MTHHQALQDRYLSKCEEANEEFQVSGFTFVIFGGAGDLSLRKLIPALYNLWIDGLIFGKFSILALGRRPFSDDKMRDMAVDALKTFSSNNYSENKAKEFSQYIFYFSMDVNNVQAFRDLISRIQTVSPSKQSDPLFYLSVPPQILPMIVDHMKSAGVVKEFPKSKIIVEKPFGRDQKTGKNLNRLLLSAFQEEQIYRIDHYLGKETVQNILFFRFGNSIFEPLWNRRYVDHVQIMVAESIGIEGRGNFYEQSGIIRDIVQNHILQLLALVAMEPPVGFEADLIRDEKIKVYRTIRPMDEAYILENMVSGQYGPGKNEKEYLIGYREEKDVAPDSLTPTYFAGKFMLDNWRWADVPFYIRTGKRMPERMSEIYIQFKQPPLKLFGRTCDVIQPNALVLSIQPEEEISVHLSVKQPGMQNIPSVTEMDFNYSDYFEIKRDPAYQRLLIDCIKEDLTLFARHDGIEAMWQVVDPIIAYWEKHSIDTFPNYEAGTWGPRKADELMARDGRVWRFGE